jgi:hypothetical protein
VSDDARWQQVDPAVLLARKKEPVCVCMPIPTKTNIAASLIACALTETAMLSCAEHQKLVEGAAARVPLCGRRQQKTLTRQQVDVFWTKLVEEMHGKLGK